LITKKNSAVVIRSCASGSNKYFYTPPTKPIELVIKLGKCWRSKSRTNVGITYVFFDSNQL